MKVRKGDVVVIHSGYGVEDRYGWIGLVYNSAKVNPCGGEEGLWNLIVKDPTEPGVQGYLATYHESNFEVIDNINEEKPVMTPKEFRKGDVVVYLEDSWALPEGTLGEVVKVDVHQTGGCGWMYVEIGDVEPMCVNFSDRWEVIDHIEEEPMTQKIFRKGDVVVCNCEDHQTHGALGEVVGVGEFTDSTKVRFGYMPSEQFTCANDRLEVIDHIDQEESKFKKDDRVEYTGDETPAFKGRTGTVLEVWPHNGNLQVVWDIGMTAFLKPKNITLINDPTAIKFTVGDFPKAELRYATEAMLKAKAEDALKDVQHQADLDATGITEHHISGTQRLLRLSHGFRTATIVCQHCNTVLKEIPLDQ